MFNQKRLKRKMMMKKKKFLGNQKFLGIQLLFQKKIFSKFDNKIGRPVIQIKKDGFIEGKKVYGRIFDYNRNLAKRFPNDHYPSSKYSNDYGTQNINAIQHLLDDDNRTMTSYWSTYLRGEKKKKFLQEEIKRREKKLRDRSQERNYAGK